MNNSKNPVKETLKKRYPNMNEFLFETSYFLLKHIINEKGLNEILLKNGKFYGIDFANAILNYLNINYNLHGKIPDEGRYIFTSNHPSNGIDGNILMSAVGGKNKNIKFFVADFISEYENYKDIFLPTDFSGKKGRENTKKVINALESNSQIIIFPAGDISVKIKDKIRDIPWNSSVVNWSKKYERDIVPVYFNGKNSNLFYLVSRLRLFFKIKGNLEKLFMVREITSQRGKTFDIVFGEPIPYQNFTNEKTSKEWADQIYNKVYSLEEKLKRI